MFLSTQKISNTDSDELSLTKEEAIFYLQNILDIQDPISLAKKHRFDFLCEVQRQTKIVQPFTTVSFLPDFSELRAPTKEEVKEAMFQKQGGGCLQINSVTRAVLRQLGYEAYIVSATLPKDRANAYEGHIGLIVKDVTKKGSMHLVEAGTRHPILNPIPLDFKRASPEYQLVGHPIKLFRDSPSIVKLCMPVSKGRDITRDANLYHEDGKMWRGMITYRTLESQDWKYCRRLAEILSKDANIIPDVHREIIGFGYSRGLWTVIKGKMFVQYDSKGKETIKQFRTDEEVIENFNSCFPQYSKETLQNVIAYTNKACKLLEC